MTMSFLCDAGKVLPSSLCLRRRDTSLSILPFHQPTLFIQMSSPAGRGATNPMSEAAVANDVHDYLTQLDMLRQECERKGDFLKAHACVNRMREVNLRYAKRIESVSHQANVDTKVSIAREHQVEMTTFSRMWEEKISDYDNQARSVIADMRRRHEEDYLRQECALKVQLMNRRPRFSRQVVEMRDLLERHVRLRAYLEAEDVKQKLAALEQREIENFDDSLAVTFERKAQSLKLQYSAEMNAVQQKIDMGREELLTQRQLEFDKLMRRHNNVLSDVDQETRLHISKTRQYVHRQVKALVLDPVKTGLELRGVADTLRDGFSVARRRSQGGARRGMEAAATAADHSFISSPLRVGRAGGAGSVTEHGSRSDDGDSDGRYGW